MADEIERQIGTAADPTIVVVDFGGIRCASLACLRSIMRSIGDRHSRLRPWCTAALRFDDMARDVVDSISLLFHQSGKAMLAAYDDGPWEPLGTLTITEHQTLEILMRRESITSAELTSLAGIRLNTASTRLKKLYDRDLATRYESAMDAEGGRKFVYQRLPSLPLEEETTDPPV